MEKILSHENTMERKLPARAYYISSPEDDTVLVGLGVTLTNTVIRWYDTVKERMFEIDRIQQDDPDKLIFTRKGVAGEAGITRTYTLQPLTLPLYYEHVKSQLRAGEDFESEDALYDALDKTYQNAW